MKTSITLSSDLLSLIDAEVGNHKGTNRSQVIEEAVRSFFKHKKRAWRERKDLNLLNKHASRLNRDVEDALSYQVEW